MAAFGCSRPIQADEDAVGEFVVPGVVAEWVAEGKCCVIDCREETEREQAMIPGAICVGVGDIMFKNPNLSKTLAPLHQNSKPIVCYTNFGMMESRCGAVCSVLVEQHNFPVSRMHRLKGGLNEWKKAELPICQGPDDEVWKHAAERCWKGDPARSASPLISVSVTPPLTAPASSSSEPSSHMPQAGSVWEVVGGAEKGGVLVREEQDLASQPAGSRLATGSTIEELELAGERLHYRLLTGTGPHTGWISVCLRDKPLATRMAVEDLEINVTLDRSLDLSTKVTIKKGSTLIQLKEKLAADYPTGSTKPEDFHLGMASKHAGGMKPLSNSTKLSEIHRELELCEPGDEGVTEEVCAPAVSSTAPPPGKLSTSTESDDFSLDSKVQIRGLKSRADLNGCKATVIAELEQASGRIEVKVHGSGETVRCKPENLSPTAEEGLQEEYHKQPDEESGETGKEAVDRHAVDAVPLDDGMDEKEASNNATADVPQMQMEDERAGKKMANDQVGNVSFDDDDAGQDDEQTPEIPEPVTEAVSRKEEEEVPMARSSPGAICIDCEVDIKGLKSRADLNGRRATVVAHDPAAGRWEVQLNGPRGTERVRCKPENLELVIVTVSGKKGLGDQAFKEGRADQAIQYYQEALKEDAKGDKELAATIYSNLAAVYAKKGDHARALKEAQQAVQLRPTWAKGHSRMGLSLLGLGRDKEAQVSYIKAVECDPTVDGYLAGLRQATEKLAQNENGNNRKHEAEKTKENGNASLKAGNLSLAIAHYTMALAIVTPLASGNQSMQTTLAVYSSNRSAAFAKLQQWEWALADGEAAKRASPSWFKAYIRIGAAYLGQSHAEHAYKTFLYAASFDKGYQEAMQEAAAALWAIPKLESPLQRRRINRFSEDANRPPGSVRVFGISDVHIDHGQGVLNWAEGISSTEFKNDILLVAGDLGDTFNAVKRGLMIFKKKFRRVFYTPGNHDMWIRPNTADSQKLKFKDSISKFLAMLDMCQNIGAEMMPAEIMQNVYLVPLHSWWTCTFVGDEVEPDSHLVYDAYAKWPMGDQNAFKWFLMFNDYFIRIAPTALCNDKLWHVMFGG